MVKNNNTIASTTFNCTCCLERKQQHVDKTRKSSKTNPIYEGSSCNLCNHTNGSTTSLRDKTEVTNSKKHSYVSS